LKNIHRPLAPPLRGFARGTEYAEKKAFVIAVERTAMTNHWEIPANQNHQSRFQREKIRWQSCSVNVTYCSLSIPEGMLVFPFLPSQQKGKRNENSVLSASRTILSEAEGEPRRGGTGGR
jgi:hypothetical protein